MGLVDLASFASTQLRRNPGRTSLTTVGVAVGVFALTTIIALLFAVAGGTFFYGASGVLSNLRLFTPNGQALAAFVNLAAAKADVIEVLPQVLLLSGIGVGCAAVGLVALRNKVLS